ncbi:MAG: 5-methylthioadenosine/S-adenosylhomocysteine deaminase [Gammaproteobacteria bacterium]
MNHVDQILHASWVIPVEPGASSLADHCVAISGDRIVDVLPSVIAREQLSADLELELSGHALIPGFINCHTHAAMSLFRGLADDLPLSDWLEHHIWPAESRCVDRQFVRDGTLLAAAEMLRGATTCFNDMYFFPDETAAAAIEAGIRAVIGMIVIGFPSAWASNPDEYLHNGQQVHDRYRSHPLVRTTFAPHAPYTVDDETLRRVATLAEELDVPIQMHIHETAHEVAQAEAENGRRPLARLAELGLLSHRLIAVHMTQLSDEEISEVARAGVSVVHCPESNLKLASGFCPVAKLLQAGVNVALGSDGAASNNDLDMLSEMRTAALLAKGVANDASALPAAQALHLATLGGAQALGLETELGSLKSGKLADIAAIDLSGVRAAPVFDPISQIVYAGHRDQVSNVWVGGRQVVKNYELANLDVAALTLRANEWRTKISEGQN